MTIKRNLWRSNKQIIGRKHPECKNAFGGFLQNTEQPFGLLGVFMRRYHKSNFEELLAKCASHAKSLKRPLV